jgi:hypothetical protein
MSSFETDTSIQTPLTDAELEEFLFNSSRRELLGSDYISSNVINDVVNFYISSNSITDVLLPYDTKALRNTALSSYLPLTGGTITNTVNITGGSLNFGSRIQDYLIKLWGNDYGFGVNNSTLRYNSGSAHKFYAGSTNTFTIDGTGNITTLGNIYVGSSTASSKIYLGGGCSGDGGYDHSVIETRLFSGGENSEMLYLKEMILLDHQGLIE